MRVAETYRWFLYHIFWLFPISKYKIVVCSYYGKGFGDNGKYIVQQLIRSNLKYKIVWLIKPNVNRTTFPPSIRLVNYGSIRAIFELATAKVWIDNSRKDYFCKRSNQFYIQTWHGIPLKKIEMDAQDVLPPSYIKNAKRDSKFANVIISNGLYMSKIIQNAFWYTGEILECGTPRDDILVSKDNHCEKKVKECYNIHDEAKILLYAPTFRNGSSIDVYDIDVSRLLSALSCKFGNEWVVLLRLHPNIAYLSDTIFPKLPNLVNVTNYPDMQELLTASNVLVTDYSSVLFEFLHTNKPVFLFAIDIEKYTKERNFYLSLNCLPYSIAQSNDDLVNNILAYNEMDSIKAAKEFREKYGLFENGTASSSVCSLISSVINRNGLSNSEYKRR